MYTAQGKRSERDSKIKWRELQFDNGGNQPLLVPGCGYDIPVELSPRRRFAHGFNDWAQNRLTAREIAMLNLMNDVTDRTDWRRVVSDPTNSILSEWEHEALNRPLISAHAWDWCMTELRLKAELCNVTGVVHVYDSASRVCKSDSLISLSLLHLLESQVDIFAQRNKMSFQLHSASDGWTRLVDPNLYPLIYGSTSILAEAGSITLNDLTSHINHGKIATKRVLEPSVSRTTHQDISTVERRYELPLNSLTHLFSSSFQWLPCDIEFNNDKTAASCVRIASYINNLHPKRYSALYESLQTVISLSIAMWNDVLAWRGFPRLPERIKTYGVLWNNCPHPKPGITMHAYDVHMHTCNPFRHPEPGSAFKFEDWNRGKIKAVVPPRAPGKDTFLPPEAEHTFYTVQLERIFAKEGLQVIVEIGGIELTPERPTCEATQWSLVGTRSERIVATTILYFSSINVTPHSSAISFRVEADVDPQRHVYGLNTIRSSHNTWRPLGHLYGVVPWMDLFEVFGRHSGPALQQLGTVLTPDGRLVTFPNTLQHRIEGSSLLNPTKPGCRRFLRLHLVDPHYRICSTRNIPPQQHDWWARVGLDGIDWNSYHIPPEISEKIVDTVGEYPMSMEEAEVHRQNFVQEQKAIHDRVIEDVERYCLGEWAAMS